MITEEKKQILDALEKLKRERPPNAHNLRRRLINTLAKLDDRYGEHETHGNERAGRHEHRADCPGYDRMDDNSRP